jgi:hypothetical protein
MTQSVPLETPKKKSLPVVGSNASQTLDVDAELRRCRPSGDDFTGASGRG